jgi:hypothetical protein
VFSTVVAEVAAHESDVAGVEVGGVRVRAGVEDRHPAGALEVVLPLVGVGMPVQFAHRAGHDRVRAAATVVEAGKLVLSAIWMRPPLFSCTGADRDRRKITGSVAPHSTPACGLDVLEGAGDVAGEDPQVVQRMSAEHVLRERRSSWRARRVACARTSR